jgi:hypothetical protein
MMPRAERLLVLASALIALTLGCRAVALAASPASALGPEVAPAQPSGGYVGRMNVVPDHGPAGTPLMVTAEGLPPEQDFDLVWRTVKGSWQVRDAEYLGREYTPVAYRIAVVRSDREGRVRATFLAPEDYGFGHDIVLQQRSRLFTQVGFNLDMTVRISPESGPVGTPITVEVKGIGWRHLQNSYVLLYDNSFTGWMSTVTTHGSATFTIPATGKPGLHVLELLHADFTFAYRNMQQSPEPDRPRFAGVAAAARAAGADARARSARARRPRGVALVHIGRPAGDGERWRLRAGQDLRAPLDHGDRQPRGGGRRRLGRVVQGGGAGQGGCLRPRRVCIRHARRSRRPAWFVGGRRRHQEDRDPLDRAQRLPARRRARAGWHHVQNPPQGCGLD